jgi:hypothetical protein
MTWANGRVTAVAIVRGGYKETKMTVCCTLRECFNELNIDHGSIQWAKSNTQKFAGPIYLLPRLKELTTVTIPGTDNLTIELKNETVTSYTMLNFKNLVYAGIYDQVVREETPVSEKFLSFDMSSGFSDFQTFKKAHGAGVHDLWVVLLFILV